MSDNIHQGAKQKLVDGITKACDVITPTYGPTGYSVIIESPLYPGHMIVDDGYLALKAIQLSDPLEQRGVELLKESVEKSNKESGDGSCTATILTSAILQEGVKIDSQGKVIKDSLDECLPIIEGYLEEQSVEITPDTVEDVATISSGSKDIGHMLQEVYTHIGKDGIVELDISKTPQTFYEVVEGVRLHNCGWLYPYMTNDGKGSKATLLNPRILITRQKINVDKDLDLLYQYLSNNGVSELVIFCDDIEPTVLQTMAMAHQQSLFKTYIIKAPTLWKDWLFEDFAKITGATIVDVQTGHSFKRMQEDIKIKGQTNWLGTCDKIIISKDQTLVLGTKDITSHIESLKERGVDDDQQLVRASWLQTKTAILKVGGNSESEISLKKAKIEDARNAVYQALQNGVVKGAGIIFNELSSIMPDTIGGNILKQAFLRPRQILEHNTKSTELETTQDPTSVVMNSIKNAISVASTVLTSDYVITLNKN